jgi:glycosyltransferase involved in cell wall biosynthesis
MYLEDYEEEVMRDKLRIDWAVDPGSRSIGNAYGYAVHNRTLKEYVSKVAILDPDAQDSLIILAPEFYTERKEGKVNWLFTMAEGETVIESWVNNVKRADYLIVPSNFVKKLFQKYFDPDKIFVCNHGVKPIFTYKKKKFPRNKPFRFLWVGAPNPRKGWEEMVTAWKAFRYDSRLELYMKTTGLDTFERNGNVLIDGRDLSIKDLVKLYHSAHCFIFPTRGEGFGLTLAEAMRTGLPCISTAYSGETDFFDDKVGYIIPHKVMKQNIENKEKEIIGSTLAAFPDIHKLVDLMIYVIGNYNKAKKKAFSASIRIKAHFTWEKSAQRIIDIIRGK